MGSQQKKKKGTTDTRIIISDLKREADQDATKTAIQPTFEVGSDPNFNLYSTQLNTQIDFVNVTTTIGPSQSPS